MEKVQESDNKMADRIGGHVEIGTNGKGEVVFNHPAMLVDESGDGHIIFSPNQARELAASLRRKADDAEAEFIVIHNGKLKSE